MFNDARSIETGTLVEADLCILGAGAAGLSIAHEFIGRTTKVILIESGDLEIEEETQALYEGEDDSSGLGDTRTRFFGGSTNCWHGRCAPLNSMDFEIRDWVPHSGWPISKKELTPNYERASELLQLGSYKRFSSNVSSVNLFPGQFFKSLVSPDSKFEGMPFIHSEESVRRFGSRFSGILKKDKDIDVYLNANVVQIVLNTSANQVQEVHIATLNGKKFTVRSKNYVLALGGIENPRLLLASNSVEDSGIGNRHDLVGRYFMGHSFTDIGHVMYSGDQFCFEKEIISSSAGYLFFRPNDKTQKKERLLNVGIHLGRIVTKGETAFRNFSHDLIRGNFSVEMGKQLLQMSEDIGDLAHSAACIAQRKSKAQGIWGLMVQAEQPPNRENRVMLGHERDALGMNKLRVTRSMSELGRRSVLRATELFAAELLRYQLGRVRIDDQYLESRLFTDGDGDTQFGHDMGTTRMAVNPKDGVVNQHCQVHGANNLYIAGSSVFPTGGFANPTMTIISLALRITDHIRSA